ncbi:hypothetical protein GCM10022396_00390 [Flavivirga amylovorans]
MRADADIALTGMIKTKASKYGYNAIYQRLGMIIDTITNKKTLKIIDFKAHCVL